MTPQEAYRMARDQLRRAGVDAPEAEARLLMTERFGLDRMSLHSHDGSFPEQEVPLLCELLQKRAQGVPLQYLIGRWRFMDADYLVGEGVLIPRDDTEVAVRICLERLEGVASPLVMDLCAGSGIIALTLARLRPDARITAVEWEERAFYYLSENLRLHGADNVQAVRGDILVCHRQIADDSLDAIVSNPPYIETAELDALQKEVQHEPRTALDGGQDGLRFYRCLAQDWTPKLKPGGSMTLEIGETQAAEVSWLLHRSGMTGIRTVQDIQGLDRVVFCTKKK